MTGDLLIGSPAEVIAVALEDRGYSGNPEEFLQALAQVDEIQSATLPSGGHVYTDNGTEAGTVHIAHIGQVEHDTPGIGYESADR